MYITFDKNGREDTIFYEGLPESITAPYKEVDKIPQKEGHTTIAYLEDDDTIRWEFQKYPEKELDFDTILKAGGELQKTNQNNEIAVAGIMEMSLKITKLEAEIKELKEQQKGVEK